MLEDLLKRLCVFQVYEIANDSLMKRTMRRPLPLGRISRKHAIIFAGVVGAAGIGILAVKVQITTLMSTLHIC